jgi:hypothetical protein
MLLYHLVLQSKAQYVYATAKQKVEDADRVEEPLPAKVHGAQHALRQSPSL